MQSNVAIEVGSLTLLRATKYLWMTNCIAAPQLNHCPYNMVLWRPKHMSCCQNLNMYVFMYVWVSSCGKKRKKWNENMRPSLSTQSEFMYKKMICWVGDTALIPATSPLIIVCPRKATVGRSVDRREAARVPQIFMHVAFQLLFFRFDIRRIIIIISVFMRPARTSILDRRIH